MNINFKMLKVSKMSSLRIYPLTIVMEKLETSNLDSRVNLVQWVLLDTLPLNQLVLFTRI